MKESEKLLTCLDQGHGYHIAVFLGTMFKCESWNTKKQSMLLKFNGPLGRYRVGCKSNEAPALKAKMTKLRLFFFGQASLERTIMLRDKEHLN